MERVVDYRGEKKETAEGRERGRGRDGGREGGRERKRGGNEYEYDFQKPNSRLES